jgi:hypothetical protein
MGFDFDAAVTAPFRMQPGLRRLAAGAPQLTPVAAGSRHQREKLAVLSAFAADALCVRPGFDATPAIAALCAQAAAEHPAEFAWNGCTLAARGLAVEASIDGGLRVLAEGRFGLGDELPTCLESLPPAWRLPGLLALAFAEDFAVIDGDDSTIPWLCVCLPSHWAPREKVGRAFAAVHSPVADNAVLVAAGAHLARLVTGAERWERFVWNVTDHPRLHAHPDRSPHGARERWAGTPVASAWWRWERQSFVPLPAARQAVFLIHVEVEPLATVLGAAPGRAARLHAAIESMSPAVLDYRGLTAVRAPLLAWLAARAAADTTAAG